MGPGYLVEQCLLSGRNIMLFRVGLTNNGRLLEPGLRNFCNSKCLLRLLLGVGRIF